MKGADKQIFSINMTAFIIYLTGLQPIIAKNDRGLLYFIFPKDEVKEATTLYRDGNTQVNLQRYLAIFADLKKMIVSYRRNNISNEEDNHE